jgi:glycosyltransferase involved in cell wall biosynthesis
LRCRNSVVFTGPLHGPDKSNAFATADLFVMPSDFENFGTAIAEAMLAGLPVITTTGTPWRDLKREGAGWWISPDAESLRITLSEVLNLSDTELRARGERSRQLARPFQSDPVARRLLSVYRWLLGRRERPQCVRVD